MNLLTTLKNVPEARVCLANLLDSIQKSQPEMTGARIATVGGVTAILTKYFKGYGFAGGVALSATAVFGDTMRGIELGQGMGAIARGVMGDISIPPGSIPFMPCGCEELLKDITGIG